MFDVIALGELLIDFTPEERSETGRIMFTQNPGGAPANVLVSLAKLKKKTAFIGKVGQDQFGSFLESVLKINNINTSGLIFSQNENTTLAFVHLDEMGDRNFSFIRKPGADMMLKEEEVNFHLIENAKIFHFGSISMTHEPSRLTTLKAVKFAKEKGLIISFDPNLREPLWNNVNQAKNAILEGIALTDILKISSEEFEFIVGNKTLEEGSKWLYDQYQMKVLLITLGSEGCFYRFGERTGKVDGYKVKSIDTTGAGDAFLGGILYQITEHFGSLDSMAINDVENMVNFANVMGALVTTKKGAIPAMPTLDEVYQIFKFSY